MISLLSTSSPLSKTIGINPYSASLRAAKSPAGPAPITATSLSIDKIGSLVAFSISFAREIFLKL